MNDKELEAEKGDEVKVKVYWRRWFMLLIFCVFSGANAFNWIYFSSMPDQLMDVYGLSSTSEVDMMSLVYMICYVPFIFPAIWCMENLGLKVSLLIGSFIMAAGCWVKAIAYCPNCYPAALLGQILDASSQVFVLGLPAPVSAVWFPENEVAKATGLGVFGNNVGLALGFVLPPIVVPYGDHDSMVRNMRILFFVVAGICTLIFGIILVFFQAAPPKPPSEAQLCLRGAGAYDYKKSMCNLLTDRSFMLLVMSYSMNAGVFYTISTLLGQIVPSDVCYGEQYRGDAGVIGLLIVVAGMLGAVICGFILDKTRKFKLVCVFIYVSAFCCLIVYTFTLCKGGIWIPYVTAFCLGFFMTGYLPLGFEFAAEITYPEPEGTTSGLLNAVAQVIGVVFTLSAAKLKEKSILWSNIYLCVFLLIGLILTLLIKEDQKRQRVLLNKTSNESKKQSEQQNGQQNLAFTVENDNQSLRKRSGDELGMRKGSIEGRSMRKRSAEDRNMRKKSAEERNMRKRSAKGRNMRKRSEEEQNMRKRSAEEWKMRKRSAEERNMRTKGEEERSSGLSSETDLSKYDSS